MSCCGDEGTGDDAGGGEIIGSDGTGLTGGFFHPLRLSPGAWATSWAGSQALMVLATCFLSPTGFLVP